MKRRILSLLLVLTLLLALPVGVAATEAAKKDVDIDVRSNSTLNYGEHIVFFVHEKGNDTTPVTSGQLRIKLNDSSYGDYPVADGTVRIFLNVNLVDQDVTVYVRYLGSDLWNETVEKTIQVHMNPQPLSTVTLTSAGYAYGAPVSGFSVQSATEHVSAGEVSIENATDTTFGEKAYKVRLQLTTEKGYSLASDVAVTLDDKTGTSTGDGYYEFQLDELYPTYTITYNLDGGTISDQPTSYNKYSGTVTIPNPTKDGYRFLGWTDEDITEPQKDISFAAKEMNQNLTYTAEWEKIIYHNVDFVTRHGATPQPQQVESGTKAARPADPTEDGWKFKGWYISDNYIGEPFDFTTAITENTTLYAKWVKTCTVTFDVNGHGTAPDPQTVDIGTKAVKPTDPVQTGWRFDGWYTDKDCTAAYDFDKEVTEDITLYAKWVKTVTVTYHVGSYGTAPASQTVDAGKKFTRPADPVDSRAIFQGWYTDENYTTAYDFGSAVETDLNLYAKWKDGYRVVFQTAYGTAPAEQKVALNGKATKPADPTATGYIFKGWYTSQLYTAEFDFNTPIAADTTLYAKWDEIYTVTFNVGGHGTAPAAQKVENGGKATKPENPTAKGWRFDGWYTDERCTARYDFDKAVTANTTLYAKWTQLFTLTFETNGGTKIDSVEAPDGSLVYLGSYKPTKSGYYFVGWYTDKNLTRESRVGYVRMDGNKTVYAKFAVADKTNPKTADPALPGLALAVLSFSTVGLAAMGLKKRK